MKTEHVLIILIDSPTEYYLCISNNLFYSFS